MSATVTREELFQQVLIERCTGEETKDELREKCDAAGMFEDDPRVRRAIDLYKDRVIAGMARQGGWVDKDGEPLELVNIHRTDPQSGKKVHLWIDLRLATFDDQAQLVRDRLAKSNYFRDEARRYYDDGCRKFGRKFQQMFNLG